MAPTEILAEQHYRSLAPLLEPLGIPCALLTASTKARERRALNERLRSGELSLVIGTHALLSPDVQYQNLGLVVTDEQHRFGVDQRAALSAKGDAPHLLVMSATPIPRTLALMIYGDLDVSILNELPPGRQKIDTFAVPSSYHERIYAFCASSSPRAVRPISSAPWSRKTTSSLMSARPSPPTQKCCKRGLPRPSHRPHPRQDEA